MNKYLSMLFLSLVVLLTSLGAVQAQAINTPLPSPNASVMQNIGLTEIKITYSAPGVKGREVWGKLVPYDSLWRVGANAPTKISFSTDVTINGEEVKEGEYSLYATLNESSWTFILSKDSGGNGVFSYKKSDDVLRFPAKVEKVANSQERLVYHINPDTDEQGTVTLKWEKLKASFQVKADLKKLMTSQAQNFIQQNWFNIASASEYFSKNDGNPEAANKLADAALGMAGENLYTAWVKAQALAIKGDKAGALAWGEKAKKMGDESTGGFLNFYNTNVKEPLAKSLKEWK